MNVEPFDTRTPLAKLDARIRDVFDINRIRQQVIRDPDTLAGDADGLMRTMSREDHFVVRDENTCRIVGTVAIEGAFEMSIISLLAVDAKRHGRGYGRSLAAHALDYCLDNGDKQVVVDAAPSSQGIFIGLGFSVAHVYSTGYKTMVFNRK